MMKFFYLNKVAAIAQAFFAEIAVRVLRSVNFALQLLFLLLLITYSGLHNDDKEQKGCQFKRWKHFHK